MKRCQFCAEEIQDAAKACKHCGRELVPPKRKTSAFTWIVTGFLFLVVVRYAFTSSQPTPHDTAAPAASPASAAPLTPAPSAPTAKWVRLEEQSKMDDSKTVTYGLQADNEITGWLAHERPTLMARCQEGKVEAFVVTGMAASVERGAEFHEHSVHLRFDDAKANTQHWGQSTDDKALFAPSPVPFLRSIAGAKRLRFEFTPFNASPQLVEFDTSGFTQPWTEIETTCRAHPK